MFLRCICMQILAQSSKNPYFSYSLDAIGEAKWFCWSLNAYPLKRPSYPLWTELQAIFFQEKQLICECKELMFPRKDAFLLKGTFLCFHLTCTHLVFMCTGFKTENATVFLPCLSTTKLVTKDEVTTRTAESVLLTKRYSAPSATFKTH